jgi:protein phosphatase
VSIAAARRAFRAMAEATGQFTNSVLAESDKQFLRNLPASAWREVDGKKLLLCHATPSDPLFEYRPPDSSLWQRDEKPSAGADVVLVGHTHLQFASSFGKRMVVNPGSLGQSKSGDPGARYAVWQDGEIILCTVDYPIETTVAKINSLPLPEEVRSELTTVLRTGKAPPAS